jgi:uncharacterized membrane protein YccF (DUF307 family)
MDTITVIGIPFAMAHLRLAGAAPTPFRHTVVSSEEAKRRQLAHQGAIEPLGGLQLSSHM